MYLFICRYLLYHIEGFYETSSSEILNHDEESCRFCVKEGIDFHFFTSHTPCGDASIFPRETIEGSMCSSGGKRTGDDCDTCSSNVMKRQKVVHSESDSDLSCCPSSSEPNQISSPCTGGTSPDTIEGKVLKDIYRTGAKCVSSKEQDQLLGGVEYHKTGLLRTKPGRGERTMSMCCSDKLAKWNIVGCQGALLSHLLDPVYFNTFVVGR
jgi:tRNA-specific adenosine deaminase 1